MSLLLIKSGTLVTPEESFQADILVEDEKIIQVNENIESPGARLVDASGKLVLPGGVDPHTHFDLPMFGTVSSDDHYTGHKAAAFGGTTTVIDFIPQEAAGLQASLEAWQAKAAPKAAIDYSFHMNITHLNREVMGEIPRLPGWGISTLKVFMAYNGRLRLADGDIFRVMRLAAEQDMLTMLHAESGDVIDILVEEALRLGHLDPIWHARTRPAWGAVEAVFRGSSLAAQAGARLYVVHMNAAGEVDQLKYARQHGARVMGETCPQYLCFTETDLERPDGAKWVCSPPVRTVPDQNRLWEGLQSGVLQVLATDHCPFFFDGTRAIQYEGQPVQIPGKELGKTDFSKIPNGLPVVGDRLPIAWTVGVGSGRLTPGQFVALTSANPARIFGLYPRKGCLLPGADADIVIWDPQKKVKYGVATTKHRTDYNLFEGWQLTGFPEKVFLRGNLLVDQDSWMGRAGMGKYLHRGPGVLL